VGTVVAAPLAAGSMSRSISVKARLLLDERGNPAVFTPGRAVHASVDWEMRGTQATRANKAALMVSVTIGNPGPHDPGDIRRCVALHAPQRSFRLPQSIVAMQCGVAAAALLEAIC